MFNLFKRNDPPQYAIAEEAPITGEIHTPENPYCGDPTCWCNTDLGLHAAATEFNPHHLYPQEEINIANSWFGFGG